MIGDVELAGVVLAAGAGTRLRPLTDHRPKALCPVGGVPLVDLAIARARRHARDVAVNVGHGRAQMEAHLAGRVHLSIEEPRPLGTAGALGALRSWIDGRAVLLHNADAWLDADVDDLVGGWDGNSVRLLVVDDPPESDFGRWRYAGVGLVPWRRVSILPAEPCPLLERVFEPARADGDLDLHEARGRWFDCGTISDYHAANMAASGGRNVVGEGARVEGEIERCVVWSGGVVRKGERLRDAIRIGDGVTVLAGSPPPSRA